MPTIGTKQGRVEGWERSRVCTRRRRWRSYRGTWRGVVRGRDAWTAVIHLAHAVRQTLLFLLPLDTLPCSLLCLYPAYVGRERAEPCRAEPNRAGSEDSHVLSSCTCNLFRCSRLNALLRRWGTQALYLLTYRRRDIVTSLSLSPPSSTYVSTDRRVVRTERNVLKSR